MASYSTNLLPFLLSSKPACIFHTILRCSQVMANEMWNWLFKKPSACWSSFSSPGGGLSVDALGDLGSHVCWRWHHLPQPVCLTVFFWLNFIWLNFCGVRPLRFPGFVVGVARASLQFHCCSQLQLDQSDNPFLEPWVCDSDNCRIQAELTGSIPEMC